MKTMEKLRFSYGFSMVFTFLAKSLPNQKNEAMEHAGTLKMEAWAPQTFPQFAKITPGISKMRSKSAKRSALRVPQWLAKGAMAAQLATASAPKSKS